MPTPLPLDLAPARWIRLGGEPAHPGPFTLFRRTFDLDEIPAEAGGWLLARTGYRLSVNGRRLQAGPAPSDPGHPEADPVDLRPLLRKGRNTIGVHILGLGSPLAPGLLAHLATGNLALHSGPDWEVAPDPARTVSAGTEVYDSPLFPHGWDDPDRGGKGEWTPAQVAPESEPEIFARSIPLMREETVRATGLVGRTPFGRENRVRITEQEPQELRFALPEPLVGWPLITADAPVGTPIEIVAPDGKILARLLSRGMEETFETYEAVSLGELIVRLPKGGTGVTLRNVAVRRRESAFPFTPVLKTDDPALQARFDAAIRSLRNTAGDVILAPRSDVPRQSVEAALLQLGPVRTLFGGIATSARFLRTFAPGQLESGLWPEAWPPIPRLGEPDPKEALPSLPASIAFILSLVDHAEHTGDLTIVRENSLRLTLFLDVLRRELETCGLDPATDAERLPMDLAIQWTLARMATITPDPSALWQLHAALDEHLRGRLDGGEASCLEGVALSLHLLSLPSGTAPEALDRLSASLTATSERDPLERFWTLRALHRHRRARALLDAVRASEPSNESVAETLFLAHEVLLGLRSTGPGYAAYEVRPTLASLAGIDSFETIAAIPTGALRFRAAREGRAWRYEIISPRYGVGSLVMKDRVVTLMAGMRETFRELND